MAGKCQMTKIELTCIGGEHHGQRMEQDYAGYTARPFHKKDGIGGTRHISLFNISNAISDSEAVRLINKINKLAIVG